MVYQWMNKSKMDKVAGVDTHVMNKGVCADREGREGKIEREREIECDRERGREREREGEREREKEIDKDKER